MSHDSRLGPRPENYLVWAILATLCCCLPAGIVAIVYAASVDSRYAAGDLPGANRASDQARLWCWISLGAGILMIPLLALLQLALAVGPQ